MVRKDQNERIFNLRSGHKIVRAREKAANRRSKSKKPDIPCEPPKTQNAAERVFRIGELCEMILCNLPPRDALATRRVSRAFESAIQGSQDLQRRSFLRPVDSSDTSIVKLNEMIFSKSRGPERESARLGGPKWFRITGYRTESIMQMRQQLRPEDLASKMLITQPSVSKIMLHLHKRHEGQFWDFTNVEVDGGVTFGDVVGALARLRPGLEDSMGCLRLGIEWTTKVEYKETAVELQERWIVR